ncbi:hypothetical protein GW931_03180 [archaeon]|nr:hypothetical protein [archaeon]PJC45210.1 MAG: hypothetical protein CO037_02675 [Candidatus Pacearchaeota archaeon CG_4_9_14_0_2_um_filter_30_8]
MLEKTLKKENQKIIIEDWFGKEESETNCIISALKKIDSLQKKNPNYLKEKYAPYWNSYKKLN